MQHIISNTGVPSMSRNHARHDSTWVSFDGKSRTCKIGKFTYDWTYDSIASGKSFLGIQSPTPEFAYKDYAAGECEYFGVQFGNAETKSKLVSPEPDLPDPMRFNANWQGVDGSMISWISNENNTGVSSSTFVMVGGQFYDLGKPILGAALNQGFILAIHCEDGVAVFCEYQINNDDSVTKRKEIPITLPVDSEQISELEAQRQAIENETATTEGTAFDAIYAQNKAATDNYEKAMAESSIFQAFRAEGQYSIVNGKVHFFELGISMTLEEADAEVDSVIAKIKSGGGGLENIDKVFNWYANAPADEPLAIGNIIKSLDRTVQDNAIRGMSDDALREHDLAIIAKNGCTSWQHSYKKNGFRRYLNSKIEGIKSGYFMPNYRASFSFDLTKVLLHIGFEARTIQYKNQLYFNVKTLLPSCFGFATFSLTGVENFSYSLSHETSKYFPACEMILWRGADDDGSGDEGGRYGDLRLFEDVTWFGSLHGIRTEIYVNRGRLKTDNAFLFAELVGDKPMWLSAKIDSETVYGFTFREAFDYRTQINWKEVV
jgi:hypothetical protein